jgi:signal transduction histidine kinase
MSVQTKDGNVLPMGVASSLLQSQQGILLGAIALFSDLTEMKKLEMEKWKAEKLAYIGTLAASVAHEIKNPLVSIKTLAQLLPDRHGDSEFRTHFSQIALKEVDRIDLLVSQMLDLKGNNSPTHFEILLVEEIVEEILLLLSEPIQRQKIRVERKYRSSPYATWGDRLQLKQAFWNVILNSIQAMETGGVLTVCTECSGNGGDSEEKLILRISDTGNGIPEDHLGKIFDPFFTTKQKGTGLGLSICYKIIADHRGQIQVESRPSQGTSLCIHLPAIKPSIS